MTKICFDRVAVIGASMAGLLAARVLAEHAREVVLIERDRLRTQPAADPVAPRKGVPQAAHAHVLLEGGQQVLEALFPDFAGRLCRAGAEIGGGLFHSHGGFLEADPRTGTLLASRGLIEAEVRARVLALPQVRLLDAAQADPPRIGSGRISGLRVQRLDGGGSEQLETQLVVDATGRGSRTPSWLADQGLQAPPAERIEIGMRYATRHVRRAPGDLGGRGFIAVAAGPALPRGCGILTQEGGRWIVTLIGYFGDAPPTDDVGFLDFARSLPTPEPAALIERAEPLDAIRSTSFPANVRMHYEHLAAPPPGLIVIGDALAAFSPIYGQGMSVAALQARALQRCLAEGAGASAGLERRYYAAVAREIDAPWMLAAGNDRQLIPGARSTLVDRLQMRWVGQVIRAGHRDPVICESFLRVVRLVDPPTALARPALVARVLRHHLRAPVRQDV